MQHYLYVGINNVKAVEELAELEDLSGSIRKIFWNRLNKQFENQEERLGGDESVAMKTWPEYQIAEKKVVTPIIASFVLEAAEPVEEPSKVEPDLHVRLKFGGKLIRVYSVIGGNMTRLELGIALEP